MPIIRKKYIDLRDRDHRYYEGAKSGDPLPFTLEEFRDKCILALEVGVCGYCLKPLTIANLSPDHTVALSAGGKTTLDNIEIICWTCNKLKGGSTGDELMAILRKSSRIKKLESTIRPWEGDMYYDMYINR